MTTHILFYCPGHLSFAPHVILRELGEPFDLALVSIKDGATQSAEFRQLNPKGKVPVLHTGDEVLTESSAILLYLALRFPHAQLVPATAMGIARAVEWMNWLASVLPGTVALNFHPSRFSDDAAAHNGIREKGRTGILAAYAQIEERLVGRDWALGAHYSIVDPMLLIFFKWGNMLKLDMRGFAHWAAHTERMLRRPAVTTALSVEQISVWE
ncbi:glutathione S-transferase N-terminal domain-containing protein [Burkholderia cenocepacia]|uniref:glutathione S-transferase family protein n=1 Tax=Burkholderia cenocepacia TaxID=95486 RepID=UPI001B9B0660|nr:glutathione S-transferase N-terminal domain-containing protein [Burkholderia cenocepacia]MBR8265373.1 glutathione S-transferase N-terminal domain-containing protein [Burkholderia cenocepacia]MBR8349702.1 glutathione S-transferase N-terminal domain-containing protein [Burkholderia cenocepacia]MCO8327254.1 glutathione S-transferase N-terminal domain-containing protein [Burkholderia cenocepacia]MCO8334503.1 glutathione S-transferase N-terminal domain-containing protein [Burkholderia cenocepacia